MLSFHRVPCAALWETLKSLETFLRELSRGDGCEGRLFPCNPGAAFRSVTQAIHRGTRVFFFQGPSKDIILQSRAKSLVFKIKPDPRVRC